MAFDPYQYIASYGDLIRAFGDDAAAGQRHYLTFGIAERRKPDDFDEKQYLANYADLRQAFGGNGELATQHFIRYGFAEGRTDAEPLPPKFDGLQYIASYADLIDAFGANPDAGRAHYQAYGRAEGRVADRFDEKQYLANYPDLAAAFHDDGDAATLHYILFGKDEGRTDAVPGNTPPVAVDDAFAVGEDSSGAIVKVLANDSDADAGDVLTVAAVGSLDTLGNVTLGPRNTLFYDPNGAFEGLKAGETATDRFQYTVSDGHGGTATATAVITVTGANDAPLFTSPTEATVAENTTQVVQVAATDPEGSRLLFDIGGPDGVAFAFDGAGNLIFKEAPDYEAPGDENGDNVYEVQVTAGDGDARTVHDIAVTVADVDDVPVITSPAEVEVAENTTAVLELTATDPQNDPVAFTLSGGADVDLFAIAGSTLSFAAPPDFEAPTDKGEDGIYQVEVTASDPAGNTASLALSVTVTDDPADDPPPEDPTDTPPDETPAHLDFMF
ncbi:MAG: Ig-like domain-containing protein [Geminicoccaceae bacterium]